MGEIVEGLDRERIAALRASGRFFWVDAWLGEVTPQDLIEVLSIPEHALGPLLDFDEATPPSRNFHADGEHVVFAFTTFEDGEPIEVHVLVSGDYLLTVHQERVALADMLRPELPEHRTEQYLIYSVLDAMVLSSFDTLNAVERELEELQVGAMSRRSGEELREITARLFNLRRRIAPQRGAFDRVSEEIDKVEGLETDSDRYFERIAAQLNRLVGGIDAAADSASKLVAVRLNEIIYRLTVVATVFLPLTFVTGFFGMNFGWMVDHIDTFGTFLLLGVGGCLVPAIVTAILVRLRDRPS
jgi:magnesium transporter